MEYSLDQYSQLAKQILKKINAGSATVDGAAVIALHGNLGAGKTTLSQELIKQLGVTESVTSPTFIIEKEYEVDSSAHESLHPSHLSNLSHIRRIVHIDTYRLEKVDDLLALDFKKDLVDPHTLIIIEWPELVADLLTQNTIHIYIDYLDKDRRSITIKSYGEEASEKNGSERSKENAGK